MLAETFYTASDKFINRIPKETRIDQHGCEDDHHIKHIWKSMKSTETSNGKPAKFACVLLYYSNSKKINKAINEWNEVRLMTEPSDECNYKCICSQDIEDFYYVVNSVNGNILRIGSSCIMKFGCEKLKEEVDILQRKKKYEKTGKGDKRMCESCHKFRININKPSHIKLCRNCYNEKNEDKKKRQSLPREDTQNRKSIPREDIQSRKSIPRENLQSRRSLPREDIQSRKSVGRETLVKQCHICKCELKESWMKYCNKCYTQLPKCKGCYNKIGDQSMTHCNKYHESLPKCKGCSNKVEEKWMTYCTKCYGKENKCISCDNKVPQKWMKHCNECYNKTEDRTCITCKRVNIPSYYPTYRKNCLECHNKHK